MDHCNVKGSIFVLLKLPLTLVPIHCKIEKNKLWFTKYPFSPVDKPPKWVKREWEYYYDFFAEMSSLRCLVTDSDGCPASMFGQFFL